MNPNDRTPTGETYKYSEIANSSLEDALLAHQQALNTQPAEEAPKEDAKPVETPAATPKVEPTPQFDPAKLKAELSADIESKINNSAEKISQSTAERIVSALAGDSKSAEEKKDILAEAPWVKENRNPSWEEALRYMGQVNAKQIEESASEKAAAKVLEKLQAEVDAEEKAEAETKQQQQENYKKQSQAWGEYWNAQLEDLTTQGKLPAVVDQNSKDDPGKLARLELLTTMKTVNEARIKEGKPEITSLKEIYYEHYKAPNSQPAGADAPVAGAKKAVSSGSNDNFKYSEIHNTSLDSLLEQVSSQRG